MNKLLETFGRYVIDKNTPHVDYVFKFENGYGALLVIEKFANVEYYSVATIKFEDNSNRFELVIQIPERHIRAAMCKPVDEACEYLQSIKDL